MKLQGLLEYSSPNSRKSNTSAIIALQIKDVDELAKEFNRLKGGRHSWPLATNENGNLSVLIENFFILPTKRELCWQAAEYQC